VQSDPILAHHLSACQREEERTLELVRTLTTVASLSPEEEEDDEGSDPKKEEAELRLVDILEIIPNCLLNGIFWLTWNISVLTTPSRFDIFRYVSLLCI
jgi:hypothetical protein